LPGGGGNWYGADVFEEPMIAFAAGIIRYLALKNGVSRSRRHQDLMCFDTKTDIS
jgi:hypothetical protein